MLNLNKNKLIPATEIIAYWGEIKGDISKQTDLVELTTDLDTSIKGWVNEQGFLTEHQDLSDYALKTEIPSLDGYATENWVESKGYVTAETLPEGIATESWVTSQGYISDPNNDLTPLFNKQDGYLRYNLITPSYSETWIGNANFPTRFGANYVFNVGGEVYNFVPFGENENEDNKIYKFNEASGKFEMIAEAYGNVPYSAFPMWKTPDGITRYGIGYTVDLQTGTFGEWQHSTDPDGNDVSNFYQSYPNIDDVVLGTNGRPYVVSNDFDKAFVWNYNDSDFTITVPVSGVPDASYWSYHCYFNGKYLIVLNSVMYEFVEHFDEQGEVTSVSFEVVSTPYFPLTTVNGTTVDVSYVKQLDSITVYLDLNNSIAYQLVDGVWTVIEGFTFDEVPGEAIPGGCTFKDCLFGYGYSNSKEGMIPFYNFGPKLEFYGWDQIDLSKYATEDWVSEQGYVTETLLFQREALYVYDPIHRLEVSTPNSEPLVDGKEIANIDMCITNSARSYPGSKFEGVAALLDGMQTQYEYYFKTPSGRIIYTNPYISDAYEFNGTEWIPLQSVTNFVRSQNQVELNDGLYAVNITYDDNDLGLYRWDDTNSNWEYIIQAPDSNIWATDENTLRCSNNQKLVNNDGTYHWEEDLVYGYPDSGVLVCVKLGQDYYYMNENNIYTYNEVDKSFKFIGQTIVYPSSFHLFTYDGCLYYFGEDQIRKVDPSKIDTGDEWDTRTDIHLSSSGYVYVEYDNTIWTYSYNYSLGVDQIGYTYGIIKSAPAAPTQDGTYVLKATVLNGKVTYSWVVDEVPQAVQITNQILG